MQTTKIEWADMSVNPIRARYKKTGAVGHYCEKIAPGCTHCYSSALQVRFKTLPFGSGQHREQFDIYLDRKTLESVRKRKKPAKIFWVDMSDIFGEWVEQDWLDEMFATMRDTPQHTHMLLTKRLDQVGARWPLYDSVEAWCNSCRKIVRPVISNEKPECENCRDVLWPKFYPNVWFGTSVSDQPTLDAARKLAEFRDRAGVLFLSCEPLLAPLDLSWWFENIPREEFWCVVGGESGRLARPCKIEWIESIVEQCRKAQVKCFTKQIGADPVGRNGEPLHIADRKGGNMMDWPLWIRVREFPMQEDAT